jgi:hypothetical protein
MKRSGAPKILIREFKPSNYLNHSSTGIHNIKRRPIFFAFMAKRGVVASLGAIVVKSSKPSEMEIELHRAVFFLPKYNNINPYYTNTKQ